MTLINDEEVLQELEGVEGLQELVKALRACQGLKIRDPKNGHDEILKKIKSYLESSKRHAKLFDELARDLERHFKKNKQLEVSEQSIIDISQQFKEGSITLLMYSERLKEKLEYDLRLQHKYLHVSVPDDGLLKEFILQLEAQIKKLSSAIQFQKDIRGEAPPNSNFFRRVLRRLGI